MKEAMLWEKERNGVRCILCARRCFISKEKKGFCQVRVNKDNTLYTLNYGKLVAVNVDPIEKKPFFHFLPGSTALSIAAAGCNFKCQFCNNSEFSQSLYKDSDTIPGKDYTPEQVVELAEKNNCKSIAYTYTEPTMFFEFAYKTAKMAKRNNIMNVFVTNGYMTDDAIKKISKYMDAVVVDIKASLDPEFYKKFMSVDDVQPIYDCLKQIKKQRIPLEITNLIIPQIGDSIELSNKLAEHINTHLNSSVPLHILQFQPSHKLMELPPTPIATLERCVMEARKKGLRYVYIGNVAGHDDENTYCYNCRELIVKRFGAGVQEINMTGDRCPYCGANIDIVVDD